MSAERQFGNVLVQPNANASDAAAAAVAARKPIAPAAATVQTMIPELADARAKYQELKKRNMKLGEHFDTLKEEYFKLENVNEDVIKELEESKSETLALKKRVDELSAQLAAHTDNAGSTASATMVAAPPVVLNDNEASLKIEGLTISNEYLRDQVRDAAETEQQLRQALAESQERETSLQTELKDVRAAEAEQHTAAFQELQVAHEDLRAQLVEAQETGAKEQARLLAEVEELKAAAIEAQANKEAVVTAVRSAVEAEIRSELSATTSTLEARVTSLESDLSSTQAALSLSEQALKQAHVECEKLETALASEKEAAEAASAAKEQAEATVDNASEAAEAKRAEAEARASALGAQVEQLRMELRNAEADKIHAYRQNKRKLEDLEAKYHATDYSTRYAELVAENNRLKAATKRLAVLSSELRSNAEVQRQRQQEAEEVGGMLKGLHERVRAERAELQKLVEQQNEASAKIEQATNSKKLQEEVDDLKATLEKAQAEQAHWSSEKQDLEGKLADLVLQTRQLTAAAESRAQGEEQDEFDAVEENIGLKAAAKQLEQALSEANEAGAEANRKFAEATASLEKSVADANARIAALEEEIEQLTQRANSAEDLARDASSALELEKEKKLELQGENNLIVDMLKQQEEKTKLAIEALEVLKTENQATQEDEIARLQNAADNAATKAQEHQEAYAALEVQLKEHMAAAQAEKAAVAERCEELEAKISEFKSKIDNMDSERDELLKTIAAGEAAADEAEQQTLALQNACLDANKRAQAHSDELEALRSKMAAEMDGASASSEEVLAAKVAAEKAHERCTELEAAYSSAVAELDAAKAQLAERSAQLSKIEKTNALCQAQLEQLCQLVETQDKLNGVDKAAFARAQQSVGEVAVLKTEIEELRSNGERLTAEKEKMMGYLKQFKTRHDRKVKQFKGELKKMAIALMRVYEELKKICAEQQHQQQGGGGGSEPQPSPSRATALARLIKDLGAVTDAIRNSDVLEASSE